MNSRELGRKGEYLARLFLEKKGLEFIRANYTRPCGEIDLILRENDEIVFMEVKTRSLNTAKKMGRAADKIDKIKQKKILKTASCFLREEPDLTKDLTPRFDAIEVYLDPENEEKVYILYTPFAFGA